MYLYKYIYVIYIYIFNTPRYYATHVSLISDAGIGLHIYCTTLQTMPHAATRHRFANRCNTLQHTSAVMRVCCSVLQCVAVPLQQTATHSLCAESSRQASQSRNTRDNRWYPRHLRLRSLVVE